MAATKQGRADEQTSAEQLFLEELDQFRLARRSPKQKQKAREVAEIAVKVLIEDGLDKFSMRRVAERCGMSLAALQYHFATLAELLKAMIDQCIDNYVDAAQIYLRGLSDDPQKAFQTHIDWYIEDCKTAATARFTAQFQALACTDVYAAEALDAYMKLYRTSLGFFLRRANPVLGVDESVRRGAVIAGMLDGLMIIASEDKPSHSELRGIEITLRQAVFSIAYAPQIAPSF
jgi:AcrR family transcriptional regulator